MAHVNGATYIQADPQPKAKVRRKKAAGGGGGHRSQPKGAKMSNHAVHPPHHTMPTWLYPVIINVAVMLVSAGISYGLLKGDIDSLKATDANVSIALSSQALRIDSFVKEQERVTRLEERLGNIASLLQEIRADLREGRYSPTGKPKN